MKTFVVRLLCFCSFLMPGVVCEVAVSQCSDGVVNQVKAATVFISARRTLTNTGQVVKSKSGRALDS